MVTKVTAVNIQDKVTTGDKAATLINDNKRAINQVIDAKEESLGNPVNSGRLLSSTADGVRKWVDVGRSRTFQSVVDAVNYVTVNPNTLDQVTTVSYRNKVECTSLGIDYPDGNGGEYTVVEGESLLAGLVIAAGAKQLKLITQKINKPLDTIADLRNFKPTVGGQTVDVLGHTIAGIGGGQFYYDPDDTASADNNGTVIVTSSGERWKRINEARIKAEVFGVLTDNSTDNTVALTALKDSGIPALFAEGVTIHTGSIFDADPMKEGLDWEGASRGKASVASGSVLKYTGSTIGFNIKQPNSSASRGGMVFTNLTFHVDKSGSSAFEFNDPTIPPLDSPSNPEYIRQVSFRGCSMQGSSGAGSRGISGTKMFELLIDAACEIRDFERGVYLYGCDNCTIEGRFVLNTRNIMIERVNTFGNDNLVQPRFLGTTRAGAETAYNIYDAGEHTTMVGCELEDVSNTAEALMYLDGRGSRYFGIDFSANGMPIFRLGPNATDLLCVGAKTVGNLLAPLVDSATTIETSIGSYSGITFSGATRRIMGILSGSARVRSESGAPFINDTLSKVGGERLTTNGVSLRRFVMSPQNYSFQSNGIGFTADLDLVPDTESQNGSAIHLKAINNAGFLGRYTVGKHIQNNDTIKVTYLYKYSAIPAFGDFRIFAGKNVGTILVNTDLPKSTTYTTHSRTFQLTGAVDGDNLDIGCFNNQVTDATLNLALIIIEVVEPDIVNTSGAALADLEAEVNKMKEVLRISGVIGG